MARVTVHGILKGTLNGAMNSSWHTLGTLNGAINSSWHTLGTLNGAINSSWHTQGYHEWRN